MINLRKKKLIVVLSILTLFVLVLTGCGGVENGNNSEDDGTLNQAPQEEEMPDEQNPPEPLPDEPAAENPVPENNIEE